MQPSKFHWRVSEGYGRFDAIARQTDGHDKTKMTQIIHVSGLVAFGRWFPLSYVMRDLTRKRHDLLLANALQNALVCVKAPPFIAQSTEHNR